MTENLKLLVLSVEKPRRESQLRAKFDRRKELAALAQAGAKVCHDSGGRLIVIDVPEGAVAPLLKRLPGAQLLDVSADVKGSIKDPDGTEALFLDALAVRSSPAYREAKRLRKFGETPEERQLVTGSCVRGY